MNFAPTGSRSLVRRRGCSRRVAVVLLAFALFATDGPASSGGPDWNFGQSLTVDAGTTTSTWTYTWRGRSGFRYVVLSTPDLTAPWVQLPFFSATGADALTGVAFELSGEMYFFRVLEYSGRSAGALTDTDADGLPDVWEIAHFGDLSATATGDPDNDGMSNLAEFHLGADPTRAPDPALAATLALRIAQPLP